MSKMSFEGTVVRVEPDGLGVVKFDEKIGANTHGIFSTSISEPGLPLKSLRPGVHVSGTADVDSHDLAAVKTLQVSEAR